MNTKNKCPTILLSDEPEIKDEFGSHERLAESIFELIRTEEAGGKAIAIEGPWGSGKSTVINILNNKFNKSNNKFIIFDTWAHQGDPLRRSILEKIITALNSTPKWIDDVFASKKINQITGRKRDTEKTISNLLSPLGIFITLGVFFIPIGISMFRGSLSNTTLNIFRSNGFNWNFIFGILIAINPLISIFIDWVFWKIKNKNNKKKYFAERGAIITQNYDVTETTTTFETPNPTSVEFENCFTEVLKQSLDGYDRKLILVFDNIDRVDEFHAKSIFSTLQTFLQKTNQLGNNNVESWINKLWLIVPYAPEGIKTLWKYENQNNAEDAANRFVEKRFQVRFRVPPIILSDWHDFLVSIFSEALPVHNDNEFHKAYRMFDNLRDETSPPTPRDLKLFVNQIGSIHRQWEDTFPIVQMAYFVLKKKNNTSKEFISKLIEGDIPELEYLALLGNDVKENLAAMVFNIKPDRAMQILLEPDIIDALEIPDPAKLSKLKSTHPDGFFLILTQIPYSDWSENEGDKITNSASAIENSEILSDCDPVNKGDLITSLKNACYEIQRWPVISEKIGEGIKSLFRLIKSKDLSEHILSTLSSYKFKKEDRDGDPTQWAKCVESILIGSIENYEEILPSEILLPGNPNDQLEILLYLGKKSGIRPFWKKLTPTDVQDITDEFVKSIQQGNLSDEYLNVLDVLKTQNRNMLNESVLNEVHDRLKNENLNPMELTSLCKILIRSEYIDNISDKTEEIEKNLAKFGWFMHHLHQSQNNKSYEASSYCLYHHLRKFPNAKVPQPSAPDSPKLATDGQKFLNQNLYKNPENYQDLINGFIHILNENNLFELLFDIYNNNSQRFLEYCWKILVANLQNFRPNIDPAVFQKQRAFLKGCLDREEYLSLLEYINQTTEISQELFEQKLDLEKIDLYQDLLQIDAIDEKKINHWCKENLEDVIDENVWRDALVEKNNLIPFMYFLINKYSFEFIPGIYFYDALVWHVNELISGGITQTKVNLEWENILRFLKPENRDNFIEQVVDDIKEKNGDIHEMFFKVYGDQIDDEKALHNAGYIVSSLFTPLVTKKNVAGLKWLLNFLENNPSFLDSYEPKTHITMLTDRVQQTFNELDEQEENYSDIRKIFIEIARLLELDLNK